MIDNVKSEQKVKNTPKKIKNIYNFEIKPIAKTCRECLAYSQEITAKMSKHYKYQSGTGLLNTTMQLTYTVYDALDCVGFTQNKIDKINICLNTLKKVVILVRLIKDVNQMTTEMFEKIILMLNSMKIQILNWLHFVENEMKKLEENKEKKTDEKPSE